MKNDFLVLLSIKAKNLAKMNRQISDELKELKRSLRRVSNKTEKAKDKIRTIIDRTKSLEKYYKEGYIIDAFQHADMIRWNMYERFLSTIPNLTRQTGKLMDSISSDSFVRITARGTKSNKFMTLIGIANIRTLDRATSLTRDLYKRMYGRSNEVLGRSKVYRSSILSGRRIIGHWEFQEHGPIKRDFLLQRRKNSLHSSDRAIINKLRSVMIKKSRSAILKGNVSVGRNIVT